MSENRTDHIWFRHDTKDGGHWKCALCGAIATVRPPSPTPKNFAALRYEALTNNERGRAPYVPGAPKQIEAAKP